MIEEKIFEQVTQAFMKRISIEPQGKSQLVKVQVDMADPVLATRAANMLSSCFIESQLEASMEMSVSATTWMNSRMGELRTKLKEAEDVLQAYREKENLVDMGGVLPSALLELSATATVWWRRRSRAEAEICTVSAVDANAAGNA